MYIVAGHMDGIGWGEAANDDGSGTALVMELARIFSSPDVRTERSIRFALWNNEETGTNGARAYVAQRKDLQGIESPAGSGKYPEPKWLGMIQHDMMMFDHGMPRKDGSMSPVQRPEADVNIEYQVTSKLAYAAMLLAHEFQFANEKYATDYPAAIGPHMSNTDSGTISGPDAGHQPSRTRKRSADRQRMGPSSSSADGSLLDVQRRRFSARPERRADDAGRGGAARRGEINGRDAGRRELRHSMWGRVPTCPTYEIQALSWITESCAP